MHSLKDNVLLIVGNADVTVHLMIFVIICGMFSAVGFAESAYMSYILTDSDNVYYYLAVLFAIKITVPFLIYTSDSVYKHNVMLPVDDAARSYLWNLTLTGDPEWVKDNKNIGSSIETGIVTIKNILDSITGLIKPVVKTVSSIVFICSITNAGFICIFTVMTTLCLGIHLTMSDYVEYKDLKTAHKHQIDMAEDQSKNILNRILNYKGEQAVKNIIEAYASKNLSLLTLRLKEVSKFVLLDSVNIVLHILSVAFLVYNADNVKLTPILYVCADKVANGAWDIVFKLRYISRLASEWGPLEKCLKSYLPYEKGNALLACDDLPFLDIETQICGPSGCGKTTFMKKTVIRLFKKLSPGQFIYMDQHMRLLKSDRSILNIMSDDLVDGRLMNVNMLLYYALQLNIDNIINSDTIHELFIEPSGGEEKRIMILRALLPLLLSASTVKIIFNDEITSGLDIDNWRNVRGIIEELKIDGIKFVTIDHHELPLTVDRMRVYV